MCAVLCFIVHFHDRLVNVEEIFTIRSATIDFDDLAEHIRGAHDFVTRNQLVLEHLERTEKQ